MIFMTVASNKITYTLNVLFIFLPPAVKSIILIITLFKSFKITWRNCVSKTKAQLTDISCLVTPNKFLSFSIVGTKLFP